MSLNTATNMTAIYQSAESIKAAMLLLTADTKMITVRFRNPSRIAGCVIPSTAWTTLDSAMSAESCAPYKLLLSGVLESAAKGILARRIGEMSLFPSEIDASIFTADAIMAEAAGNASDWMTKEELIAAWEASATRQSFITNPNYTSNAHYRKAVEAYRDMIVKLAGKTTSYQEHELDKIVAKLNENDLETELGAFILRRVEQIKNKPAKPAFDLDLL